MSEFKVGDRVQVRKPAEVKGNPYWSDAMDKFDGTEQEIEQILHLCRLVRFARDPEAWAFHFDWLEPVASKTLDLGEPVEPIRSWVPEGYSVVEMAVPDAMAASIGAGNALVWRKAKIGELYLSSAYNRVKIRQTRTDDFLNVIVPTTPPAEQYREPTAADVGKMVEVRCSNKDEWVIRELLSVIGNSEIERRFICRILETNVGAFWDFARIKKES
jgi:hypothetical protein